MSTAFLMVILAFVIGVCAGEAQQAAKAPARPAEPVCHIDIPEI